MSTKMNNKIILLSIVFSLIFALSLVSAISTTSEIVSPVSGSYHFGNSIFFNISVDSSVSQVLYVGEIVSCDLSDGYCEFSYAPSELDLQEGSNTVSFTVDDETKSVSFYYYHLFYINTPSGEGCTNQDSIFFNISVDSSVSQVLYVGEIVSCDLSDGYCEFSYAPSELDLQEGSNTVSFTVDDETKSVSVCYDSQDPVITLIGGNEALMVGEDYVDKGATANDTDGTDLTSVINADISGVNVAAVGTYYVFYNVTDNAGNTAYENRTVIVNAAPIIVTGGTGGGGYCTTKWSCDDWSECVGGTQTRTCSYPANYCTPGATKPAESQSCEVESTNNEEQQNEGTTTNQGFFPTITGAVIGTNTGRWSLGILIFLILLGLAWWIIAAKKRSAKKAKK